MSATATKQIVMMRPYVTEAMRAAVADVLNSRFIGQGPKVDEFERKFSKQIVPGRDCVATGSCTDALHLAYELAGIKPGDRVLAPLFTCTATNIPLLWMGADIQFVDVAPDSLNVDPHQLLSMIDERTKAVVVVHYGGTAVDLHPLWNSRCWRDGRVPIIEDCAQALGAFIAHGHVGRSSDYACFSFQAVKHVTTCDGGMLVVPIESADSARRRRWFGIDRKAKLSGTWGNDIWEIGFKYQMTDVAAAMGIAGLDSLEGQLDHRRLMMFGYETELCGVPGISVLSHTTNRDAAWLCTVVVENREGLRRKLAEHGIESDQVHYRNDRYTIFEKFWRPGQFPNMDAIESKYLCLPLHMGMDVEDVSYICDVIKRGW